MIKKFACLSIGLLAGLCSFLCTVRLIREAEAATQSAAEAVMEVYSGRLLFAHNQNMRLPMASTTKILTAILVIENDDLNETVRIPKEATGVEGSSIYLVPEESMTRRDLLYGLMLRSGNDCAESLALLHSGSIEAFAACMNAMAERIGAKDSHFVNPHGLPAAEHYTTAHDLALIASYALKNETFRKIVSCRRYTIPDGGCGYQRELQNKNKMLALYDGADGVKTGYTKEAGRCLVTSAERNGMHIVSVVLNSPDMYNRSAELLDACFERYKIRKLFDKSEYSVQINTDVPRKKCTCKCIEDFEYPLGEGEEKEIRTEYWLPEKVFLPVKEGQEIGVLNVYLKNQLLFSQKIVSIESVEKNYFDILQEIAKRGIFQEVCGSTNFWRSAGSRAGADATN